MDSAFVDVYEEPHHRRGVGLRISYEGKFDLRVIAVLTKVGAGVFSLIILIILFIFSNSISPLPRPSAPRVRNGSTRKLYRHDGGGVYFRVTLSFLRNSDSEFSPASDLNRCSIPQGTLCFALFFLQ